MTDAISGPDRREAVNQAASNIAEYAELLMKANSPQMHPETRLMITEALKTYARTQARTVWSAAYDKAEADYV